MTRNFTRIGLAAVLVSAMVSAASADLFFDFSSMDFNYTRTNAGAVAGQVIGTISVGDNAFSTALAKNLADATQAKITPGSAFNFTFTANVVKGVGANNYSIVTTGGLAATDTSLTNKLEANFGSTSVAFASNTFNFSGNLNDLGANDSILVNGVGDAWSYAGNQGAPFDPAINIASGRSLFDSGVLAEFHLDISGVSSLDDFFTGASVRTSDGADVKITIVPVPGALLLGVIGMGTIGWMKRRFGRTA